MDAQTPETERPVEYFVIEIFGHRRHVGRVMEVDRFGTKLCRIDVPKGGKFDDGFVSHFYGGGSIFSMTPCDLPYVERANRTAEPAGVLTYGGGPRRPGHYDGIGESFEEVDAPDFSEVDDVVGETAIATAPEVIEAAPEPPPGTLPCPFPLLADIKDGDKLIADDGFTCLDQDEVLEVRSDEKGELYVPCDDGKHYLEGQRGHGEWALDRCVGLKRAPEEPKPALVETDDEILF